jgi:hypothetical protein
VGQQPTQFRTEHALTAGPLRLPFRLPTPRCLRPLRRIKRQFGAVDGAQVVRELPSTRPLPSVTTPRIICRSWRASLGVSGFPFDAASEAVRP